MFFKNRFLLFTLLVILFPNFVLAKDLEEIKKSGVIRHLGIHYSNFITKEQEGVSIEIMKLFAKHLNVKYIFVETTWERVIQDLVGHNFKLEGSEVKMLDQVPIKGDVIETGLTELAWRKKIIDFSNPIFPTQVWVINKKGSPLTPINPSSNIKTDIKNVRSALKNRSVIGRPKTCLDPKLYNFHKSTTVFNTMDPTELLSSVLTGKTDTTILDVPHVLEALRNKKDVIQIVGPISTRQYMSTAFSKKSPKLRKEYNNFLNKIKTNGQYYKILKKYYPSVFFYFPDFFKGVKQR